MLLKVDYYTSLAQAVARLERDSYEARGAIYDLALAEILKRLHAADPPLSQAEIDVELLAYREAIRRVEFGDLDDLAWLARRSRSVESPSAIAPPAMSAAPPPAAAPPVAPPVEAPVTPAQAQAALQMALSQAMPRVPANAAPAHAPVHAAPAVNPPARYVEPREDRRKLAVVLRRRSIIGRVVGRMAVAAALIALGIAGYIYATGQFDFASLTRLVDRIVRSDRHGEPSGSLVLPSERVVFHEQGSADTGLQQFDGKAYWSTRPEPSGRGQGVETILVLEAQIPERNFTLTMSMRRDTTEGAVMSHLIELKFSGGREFPVDGISAVMGLSLKGVDDKSGTALAGQSVKVAPGLFLFGLSADRDEVRRNTDLFKSQSQLDIPITFADGKTGTLAIEKGATGEQAVAAAFTQWER